MPKLSIVPTALPIVFTSLATVAACHFPDATHDPGANSPTSAASNQSGGSSLSGESYTGRLPAPDASAP